jgi:nitric oxide reductase subunit B
MNVTSFISSKRIDEGLGWPSADRGGCIEARVKDLVTRGEETASSISDRLRSKSERAVQRTLDQYDLDIEEVNERALGAMLDQYETGLNMSGEGDHLEQLVARGLVALSETLDRYESEKDRPSEVFFEALCDQYDFDASHPNERSFESPVERYELDTDRLSEAVLETIGNQRGSAEDVVQRPVGTVIVVLAAFLGQYDTEISDGSGRSVADVLGEFRELVNWYEPETDGSRRTISMALGALFIANLVAMSIGAWVSHRNAPPIPEKVQGPEGDTVVTEEQVRAGKKAFQSNGLMNQGSILGNGAYFGVDLTADALALKTEHMREYYARQRDVASFDALDDDQQAVVRSRVKDDLDVTGGESVQYSAAEVDAHRRIRQQYVERYYEGDPERGIPAEFVTTEKQARRIADFALWTAWISHANRPGAEHSYTNDWPYAPASGNRPTTQSLLWSSVSVVLLVAGGGIGVWAYRALDLAEPLTGAVDVPSPDDVSVTATQRAAARYVPIAGALFTIQTLLGALLAHYHIERTGFFGLFEAIDVDIVSLVPFTAARTWHLNLAILWITTLWLAGGLFLPGLFTDHEPRFQAQGVTALLGALVVATVGAFVGIWLGIQGGFDPLSGSDRWWWLGNEGLEYLEAGRLWKLLLLVGFVGWMGLVVRGSRPMIRRESRSGLAHLLAYAGGSIALLFAASMLYTPETNLAVTEFWRWWVVHMWVEGAFEFFMVAVVSISLVSMDLLEQEEAERAILFEVFAIMAAGIVGVSHHYWWVGLPDLWVPIGTTFSTLEFVPIVFVLYRALGEYRSLATRGKEFPYSTAFLFIVGATVWNFVGAGVLGFFLNLPVLNYYEHGTYLTLAHSHAATFGAFGLLALGLGVYILRVITPEAAWDPTWFRRSFWLSNVGLAIMVFASLLPVGFLQLEAVYEEGFAAARSVEFYDQPLVQNLLWARIPGDSLVTLGALAFTAAAVRHLVVANGTEAQSNSA